MSPVPEARVASEMIAEGSWKKEEEYSLLVAASEGSLRWDGNPGSIHINILGGSYPIPHSGIYSYPSIVGGWNLLSMRFGEWGPNCQAGLKSKQKMLRDIFGVEMSFLADRARVSPLESGYTFDIQTKTAGVLGHVGEKILSAALLLPPESWDRAQTNGIVLLVDPLYKSEPLLMDVFLPTGVGLERMNRTETYVREEQWQEHGAPVVIYEYDRQNHH